MDSRRALAAEFVGSLILFATVVGSGVMAERLAGGNVAVALIGNTGATGAVLFVLITLLGPISGAHFNPAVTVMLGARRDWLPYLAAQLLYPARLHQALRRAGAVQGVGGPMGGGFNLPRINQHPGQVEGCVVE